VRRLNALDATRSCVGVVVTTSGEASLEWLGEAGDVICYIVSANKADFFCRSAKL
jgi:hypothetical protein